MLLKLSTISENFSIEVNLCKDFKYMCHLRLTNLRQLTYLSNHAFINALTELPLRINKNILILHRPN